MYRDSHFRPKTPVNILFNDGGLGDHIGRMTAIKYIRDTWKHVEINLVVPDFFQELAKKLVPGIMVRKFSDGNHYWINGHHSIQTRNSHDTLRSHIVDNAFSLLANKQVEIEDKNYCKLDLNNTDISHFNLPNKYVVLTTGFTAEVREMLPEAVNGVAQFVKSKGYEVVFLGSKAATTGLDSQKILIGHFKNDIDFSAGYDLIGKTDLLEAAKIIAGAKVIVGVDNGLLHLAGCTDTHILAGFTTVESIYRVPIRNNELGWNCTVIEPPKSLKCRFCQSNWNFMPGVNFTKCYYKEQKIDKEIKCVNSMSADRFNKELEKIL